MTRNIVEFGFEERLPQIKKILAQSVILCLLCIDRSYTSTLRLEIALNPETKLPQKQALFKIHLSLLNPLRCIATIGNCDIIANIL